MAFRNIGSSFEDKLRAIDYLRKLIVWHHQCHEQQPQTTPLIPPFNYDTEDFITVCRNWNVTPHVGQQSVETVFLSAVEESGRSQLKPDFIANFSLFCS
jgi:hypothetical protein